MACARRDPGAVPLMRTRLLLLGLVCLGLLAPVAIAATNDAVTHVECIPNPDFSPVSDWVCCVVNGDPIVPCIGH